LEGVVRSVQNSVILAAKHGQRKLAIPFIGSALFLDRMDGLSHPKHEKKARKEELAEAIFKAAINQNEREGLEEIAFVAYDNED